MTYQELNEVQTMLNQIDSAITDAHLAMEDRTDHCFDNDLSKVYEMMSEFRIKYEDKRGGA